MTNDDRAERALGAEEIETLREVFSDAIDYRRGEDCEDPACHECNLDPYDREQLAKYRALRDKLLPG